jgi:hypothetical protein
VKTYSKGDETNPEGGEDDARGENRAPPPDKSDKERGEIPQRRSELSLTGFMGMSAGCRTNPEASCRDDRRQPDDREEAGATIMWSLPPDDTALVQGAWGDSRRSALCRQR